MPIRKKATAKKAPAKKAASGRFSGGRKREACGIISQLPKPPKPKGK